MPNLPGPAPAAVQLHFPIRADFGKFWKFLEISPTWDRPKIKNDNRKNQTVTLGRGVRYDVLPGAIGLCAVAVFRLLALPNRRLQNFGKC